MGRRPWGACRSTRMTFRPSALPRMARPLLGRRRSVAAFADHRGESSPNAQGRTGLVAVNSRDDRASLLLSDGTGRGDRVLVVDDEIPIVDLIAALLEEEGFRVLRAYDGQEAWERVVIERPALVISDVAMPRLDGFGLLHRLRGAPQLCDTPVILMSAAHRCPNSARAAFLPKPFDLERMVRLVRNELSCINEAFPDPRSRSGAIGRGR